MPDSKPAPDEWILKYEAVTSRLMRRRSYARAAPRQQVEHSAGSSNSANIYGNLPHRPTVIHVLRCENLETGIRNLFALALPEVPHSQYIQQSSKPPYSGRSMFYDVRTSEL
ncbi:hypothetical protein J6590_028367 [Homalodisca vitripennis]|nr:hypothetical protein J6590_028367 [Homalodisca vitripennis]